MNNQNPHNIHFHKTAYWLILVAAIVSFYIGLRTDKFQVEYTLLALGLWAGAYFMNKLIKRQN